MLGKCVRSKIWGPGMTSQAPRMLEIQSVAVVAKVARRRPVVDVTGRIRAFELGMQIAASRHVAVVGVTFDTRGRIIGHEGFHQVFCFFETQAGSFPNLLDASDLLVAFAMASSHVAAKEFDPLHEGIGTTDEGREERRVSALLSRIFDGVGAFG